MSYLGDFALGATFDTKFTTVGTTGAPTTLAGSPVISAYVDNSTTELTAGITLSVDFDSRTGMHNVRVVATSGNGYAAGGNYQLVITTGTVGGTSVVGYVIGQFSIEARSSLRPTTAGRTLDVSAGGEAGVDWANVGSPTTALNLSGTSTKAVEPTVAGRTLDVATTGEAGLDFDNIKDATGAHTLTNITVPVVTAVTNDVGITQAGADKVWGTTVRALTDKAGFALSSAGIQALWDALTSALTTAGSIGKLLVDNINATISSRLPTASYVTPPTVGEIADQVWDEVLSGHLTAGTTGAALNGAGSAGDPWGTALPGAYGAGTAGKIVGDNLNATVSSRATQASVDTIDDFLDTEVAAILAAVDTEVAAIKAKTDNLPAAPAAVGDVPTAIQNADALLDRDMATGADSGSSSVRTPRQALRFLRNKWSIAAGTLTVTKENDTTTSWTAALTTDAAAEPVTASDPAGP